MTRERKYQDSEAGEITFVKNPRCRRMSIRVHPVKGVVVSLPWLMRYDDGLRFYLEKRDWVLSVMARQRASRQDAEKEGRAVPVLGDGSVVRTLLSEIVFVRDEGMCPQAAGGKMKISVRAVPVEDVKVSGRLYLSLDRPLTRKEVHYPGQAFPEGSAALSSMLGDVLLKLLRNEARTLLPARLALFAERYGFSYRSVSIKHNLSNWGSCSALGNINLNLNLVRLPEPVCDYVILHELAHLRHHDHGPGFHSLLEHLCSDNLARLSALGDPEVKEILSAAGRSRSSMPCSYVLERRVRKYRPF